jgi:GNAT superfamily N-acetyltransferase
VLELFGVDENYQKQGIGTALILWGIEQADKEGLEVYLDATEKGCPYYTNHHGFAYGGNVEIPDR